MDSIRVSKSIVLFFIYLYHVRKVIKAKISILLLGDYSSSTLILAI